MADGSSDLTAALGTETQRLKLELSDLDRLGQNFGQTLARAFSSAIADGRKLSDVLRSLALALSGQALTAALKPLGSLLGQLIGPGGGRPTPFAQGGVVNSPVLFPLRGGPGLMGEAGPEAVMPLMRGADGKLGVRGGGATMNVTVNIHAADAESFRRSHSQVAAAIARAVERGGRNL